MNKYLRSTILLLYLFRECSAKNIRNSKCTVYLSYMMDDKYFTILILVCIISLSCQKLSFFDLFVLAWDLAFTRLVSRIQYKIFALILFIKLKLQCGHFAPFCNFVNFHVEKKCFVVFLIVKYLWLNIFSVLLIFNRSPVTFYRK